MSRARERADEFFDDLDISDSVEKWLIR